MIAIAGFVAQELVNGTEIFEHLFLSLEKEVRCEARAAAWCAPWRCGGHRCTAALLLRAAPLALTCPSSPPPPVIQVLLEVEDIEKDLGLTSAAEALDKLVPVIPPQGVAAGVSR